MKLRDVLERVDVIGVIDEDLDSDIDDVVFNPRNARPGCVFVALRLGWLARPGRLNLALRNGATAIIVEESDPERTHVQHARGFVVVKDVNQTYAITCANLFGNAHRALRLYGVTGTKGKTTTCHLIEAALRHAGRRTGLISTLGTRTPLGETAGGLTTPEPYELHKRLDLMRAQGATDVVLEVSSMGLAEARVHGLRFAGLVFTNIGTDHLEYHGGVEEYRRTKRRLFEDASYHLSGRTPCVLNADDQVGRELASTSAGKVVRYGLSNGEIRPSSYSLEFDWTTASIEGVQLSSALRGEHNLYNLLAAFSLCLDVLGSAQHVVSGLESLSSLPGRLERVPTSCAIDVFVDYAHTPESVESVLRSADKDKTGRKLIVVLGCGGGADRAKRPAMMRVALERSDTCIVTTDNPRFEAPSNIIADMLDGLDIASLISQGRLEIITDREEAIARAVQSAIPDGVVMLLGKGHERTQEVAGRVSPFSDREAAEKVLRIVESDSCRR